MDFTPSDEQVMLRDSARRFLGERIGHGAGGATWRDLAELGWLAIAVPEDAGGFGGAIEDIVLLAEEMGRGLARAPFIGSAVLAVRLVDRIARGEQRLALLHEIAMGEIRLAPALYEPRRRYALSPVTRAVRDTGGYRLSGAKILVAEGASADGLLVSAMLDDDGIGLFLVDRAAAGVVCTAYQTVDDVDHADIRFDAVALPADSLLGGSVIAIEAIEDAIDEARLCLCSDMLGGFDRAIEMTADYLKTRVQFGKPLASFQALQHSVAELFIDASSVRSSIYLALSAFRGGGAERRRTISGCWVKTFDTAKRLTGMAVHLHGAIGFTTEYQVGHYLRRALVAERCLGDVEYHLARYMAIEAAA